MTSQDCILVDPVATPQLFLAGMYKTTAEVYARACHWSNVVGGI